MQMVNVVTASLVGNASYPLLLGYNNHDKAHSVPERRGHGLMFLISGYSLSSWDTVGMLSIKFL